MKLTDEFKILDDKIKANQAQYNLSREAAKISALLSKNLDKYLTGENSGYKPWPTEIKRAEYSPLAQIMSKAIKKDDEVKKTVKYSNDLYYDSVHNFNKYNVSNFNEIVSFDSKFDTLKKFYKDLQQLKGVNSKSQETKQRKIKVLNKASLLYDELVIIYKKEYNQVFESKDKKSRLKFDNKNLKDLDHQPDQPQQSDKLKLTKWVKVSKERFNEILRIVTEAKKK